MLATWITPEDVVVALGGATPSDDAWLIQVTSAANDFAYERRNKAGYRHDVAEQAPNDRVKTGTTLYAVSLFRERGSVDSFASFDEFATGVLPPATFGQVNRLLGIPRPAVDVLPSSPAADTPVSTAHVSSLNPSSAPRNSGPMAVTITGTGFNEAALIEVDGQAVSTTVVSATEIESNYFTTGQQKTTRYVGVRNPGELASNSLPFTVT